MSTITALEAYTQGSIEALRRSVFPAVSQGLKQFKGVDVSVEELVKLAGMPLTTTSIPQVASASVSRTKSGSATGGGCTYVFSRGDKKGDRCGKPVVGDTGRCKACANKGTSAAKNKGKSGTQSNGASNLNTTASDPNSIEANPWEMDKTYMITKKGGFLVRAEGKAGDEDIVVYGKAEGNKMVPLTQSDIKEATDRGMQIKATMENKQGVVGASSTAPTQVIVNGSAPGGPTNMMPNIPGVSMPVIPGMSMPFVPQPNTMSHR